MERFGDRSREYALVLHYLAQVEDHLGNWAEAAELDHRALGSREKILGPHHRQDVADSLQSLALSFSAERPPWFLRMRRRAIQEAKRRAAPEG